MGVKKKAAKTAADGIATNPPKPPNANLPCGWVETTIQDLLEMHYGKSLVSTIRDDDGPYPVLGSSGIVGSHTAFLIGEPSVVVGRKGSVGSVFFMSSPCWPIDTTYFTTVNPQHLDIKYVYYMLQNSRLSRLEKSTAIPGLSRSDMYEVRVLLPPLPEQTRIVNKIEELFSELDAGEAELKRAQTKLERYRQSLLKAAVDGSLTAAWREEQKQKGVQLESGEQLLQRILTERRKRWEEKQLAKFAAQGKTPPKDWQSKYPEPVKPDTSNLPTMPEGWTWASVDQVGDVQLGRQRSPDKQFGDYPTKYIRAANITENGIDLGDVLEMNFTPTERDNYALQKGDLLLTEASGSPEHVGRPALWMYDGDELFCFQNTVIRYQTVFCDTHYLLFVLTALQKLGVFRRVSGGVGINHLSAQKFSKIALPIPSLPEQHFVASVLSDFLTSIHEKTLHTEKLFLLLQAQRQNILKAAFSGQLVPQDPKDEPASVLLERIKAERANAPKTPKPRTTKPKEASMSTREAIQNFVQEREDVVFSFADMQNSLTTYKYNDIKETIFDLLRRKEILQQVFDEKKQQMMFKKLNDDNLATINP